MDADFGKKFANVMANFFSLMFQGLENLTIDGIKVKEGIILMNYIQNQKQVTMSDIKNFLDTNPSTATRRVESLAKDGLIQRINDDEDRRIVYIKLTKKGENIHQKFFANRIRMIEKFMRHISEEDAMTFLRVIEKFTSFADQESVVFKEI